MNEKENNTNLQLTHINDQGRAHMVDVINKAPTERRAIARAEIEMSEATLVRIKEGGIKKGDVLAVAQVAGIMAAKKTSDMIPLCHPLPLTGVDLLFSFLDPTTLRIEAEVRTFGSTGVEMEALTAASISALTVYDMCKAIDRAMTIRFIGLMEKSGGQSGLFVRQSEE
ncbi:cyclic pyranopterin monophosphate synthase MoaC [Sulfoacidibacillus thermotolerans]|uniref:Cyclic pyranopterin monophosphate synthase n=1 Tax=Sulfoacidibacillus thermotolerans TaxID=1765684 RepID=A0A2U3DBN2_SULT2|nr:cyclic pyranopterin monophosphate synthase MoaC [Sulfoacidibacillus thermotolerans]PWI58683.1 molybdenum cofactor biosynthesis protein C [Sulfoacidibacillus thermotolerans]